MPSSKYRIAGHHAARNALAVPDVLEQPAAAVSPGYRADQSSPSARATSVTTAHARATHQTGASSFHMPFASADKTV